MKQHPADEKNSRKRVLQSGRKGRHDIGVHKTAQVAARGDVRLVHAGVEYDTLRHDCHVMRRSRRVSAVQPYVQIRNDEPDIVRRLCDVLRSAVSLKDLRYSD